MWRISTIIILIFLASKLKGQLDAHYWSHQYGAKGLLLNGAVIASPDGETSIFYNPGYIGMNNELGFAFSFLSPTYARLRTQNLIGDNNIINDESVGYSPGYFGVRFKPFKTDKIVAGIAAFERYSTNISFHDRVVDKVNDLDLLLFRADIDFSRKISEEWIGIGLAYNPTERIGIGISQFTVWHSQSLDLNFKKEILNVNEPQNILLGWRSEFGYNLSAYHGYITKLGFSYKGDNVILGLTYTSPLYAILIKSASYYIEDHRSNQATDEFSSISNRKSVDLDEYKSPTSLGIGLEFNSHNTSFSFASEYFYKVAQYNVFYDEDDSFDGISNGEADITIDINNADEGVLNFAAGVRHKFSEKATWYGGLRTDFDQKSSVLINQNTEYLGAIGNIYHVSGGCTLKLNKNVISLGIDLGYSTKSGGLQLADLSDITVDNLFTFSGKDNVTSKFYSAMLFLTYDFIFSGFQEVEDE